MATFRRLLLSVFVLILGIQVVNADPPSHQVLIAFPMEGFRSAPYRDISGDWVIGYGSSRDRAGRPVTPRTPHITQAQAIALVDRDMLIAAKEIKRDVQVPITETQRSALADFIYNVGIFAFRDSVMLQKLNAFDYAGAAAEFPKWNRGGHRVLPGLVHRREVEMHLFLGK